MKSPCHATIANMIRRARLSKEMTQLNLANAVGTTVMFISLIESNKAKVPIDRMGAFCDILELPKKKIFLLLVNDYKEELKAAFGDGWK